MKTRLTVLSSSLTCGFTIAQNNALVEEILFNATLTRLPSGKCLFPGSLRILGLYDTVSVIGVYDMRHDCRRDAFGVSHFVVIFSWQGAPVAVVDPTGRQFTLLGRFRLANLSNRIRSGP